LRRNADHEATLTAAIALMENPTEGYLYRDDSTGTLLYRDEKTWAPHPAFPDAIRAIAPRTVWITPTRMILEYHGGLAHFGFWIEREHDCWRLSWYNEGAFHDLLTRPISTSDSPTQLPP
jgi:hypothetical protein